jgi:putative addiction module killer protein
MEIRYSLTSSGRDPYQKWLDKLKDLTGHIAIQRCVDWLAEGNFGDHKPLQEGVCELRVDPGPGYRVYYAMERATIVLLLCGGINARKQLISSEPYGIGVIINGGDRDETKTKNCSISQS